MADRLKDRIVTIVFPQLAEGFLADRRGRPYLGHGDGEGEFDDVSDDVSDDIFQATLALLYRLLLLLHAESRALLPIGEEPYYAVSLRKIAEEIAGQAGPVEGQAAERIARAYAENRYGLYRRLAKLSQAIQRGDPALNLPSYRGGPFIGPPDRTGRRDRQIDRFLSRRKVPDRYLARAIDHLARDLDDRTRRLEFIDYQSLEIRHLGSIYEGLLELKLDASGQVQRCRDKAGRSANGSFYTPLPIVKTIVEQTVGPVLDAKLAALRPRFAEACRTFQRELQQAPADALEQVPAADGELSDELFDELFEFRTLDPAMGSGHFLAEAVDFISRRVLSFLDRFPVNPVSAVFDRLRRRILQTLREQGVSVDPARLCETSLLRRHVLRRCIYGVDVDPTAVEVAKLSLWLETFVPGTSPSFLDRHLRCGNALVGASWTDDGPLAGISHQRVPLLDVRQAVLECCCGTASGEAVAHGLPPHGLPRPSAGEKCGFVRAIERMQRVDKMPDATAAEAERAAGEYGRAREELSGCRTSLDRLVAREFGPGEHARDRFFHWEIEFPEVFVPPVRGPGWQIFEGVREFRPENMLPKPAHCVGGDPRTQSGGFSGSFSGTRISGHPQIFRKEQAAAGSSGFDAIVGNPPFVRIQLLDKALARYLSGRYESSVGKFDVYVSFLESSLLHLRADGKAGFIVPNKFLTADYGKGIRRYLSEGRRLECLVDFGDAQVFPGISTYCCLVFLSGSGVRRAKACVADPERMSIRKLRDVRSGELGEGPWVFSGPRFLRSSGLPVLGDVCDAIFQGLITGADRVLTGSLCGDRVVFAGHEFPLEPGIVRPLLRGKNVRRFTLDGNKACVIYPYKPGPRGNVLIPEDELAARFPATYRYLCSRRDELDGRGSQTMNYAAWYALWCPRKLPRFRSAKILTQVLASRASFAPDPQGTYFFVGGGNAGVYGLIPRGDVKVDLWYLLGVLNSSSFTEMVTAASSRFRGGYYSYARRFIQQIPVPVGNALHGRREIVRRVSELARIRCTVENDAKAASLEARIDRLVASLYEPHLA